MRRWSILLLCLVFTVTAGCAPVATEVADEEARTSQPSLSDAPTAPEPEESGSIRDEYGLIDLWDGRATEEEYLLMPLVWTGIVLQSWDSPDEVDPDCYLTFFFHLPDLPFEELEIQPEDFPLDIDGHTRLYPAELVEGCVQAHFEVSTEHLRSGTYYIPDADAYWFAGMGSVGNAKILEVERDGNRRTIHYELYGDVLFAGSGTLMAQGAGRESYYLSNRYTPRPPTAEETALDAVFVQAGPGMPFEEKVLMALVKSGNAFYSWDDVEELEPPQMLEFYAFLASIGEAEIPADAELERYYKEPYVDEVLVESVLLTHFDTTEAFLRDSRLYDEARRTYRIGNPQYAAECVLLDFQYEGGQLTIRYEIYQNYSHDYDGELTALVDGEGGFRYQSCRSEWVGATD